MLRYLQIVAAIVSAIAILRGENIESFLLVIIALLAMILEKMEGEHEK